MTEWAAMGTTSIGRGIRSPSTATFLEGSATMMRRAAFCSANFSMKKAPPRPLIRLPAGSISSAPSKATSATPALRPTHSRPNDRQTASISNEVVMNRIAFAFGAAAISQMVRNEVEPEPTEIVRAPSIMPVSRRATAAF